MSEEQETPKFVKISSVDVKGKPVVVTVQKGQKGEAGTIVNVEPKLPPVKKKKR